MEVETGSRLSKTMKVFHDFVSNTSMHGWGFFGASNGSYIQKIFWFFVILTSFIFSGWLIKENTITFMTSFTIINLEDRSRDLDQVHFPSVVICNINPLRKSFIYWLHDNLQASGGTDVTIKQVFDLIGSQYFRNSFDNKTKPDAEQDNLLDFILASDFMEKEFRQFMDQKMENDTNFNIAVWYNNIHLYHSLQEAEEALGEYNNETKKTYHKNYLTEMATQWQFGEMITYLKWDGMDPDNQDQGKGDLFLEVGYPTSYGLCNFVTPYYRKMPEGEDPTTLKNLPKGALNGQNNGLFVMLDAETFDYGNGFADTGDRAGEGFKVAVVHHLDVAVMESNGMQVSVGKK